MPDFRFRLPSINDLTDAQQIAYNEPRGILITGGPGSGKTVVSVFRFLRQIVDDRNAQFFTFNRTLMSAVRGALRQRADLLLPELSDEQVERVLSTRIRSIFEWYKEHLNSNLNDDTGEIIKENFIKFRVNVCEDTKFTELFIDEAQDLNPMVIAETYQLGSKVTCGADRAQDIQGHYAGPADDTIFNLLRAQNNDTIRQELTQNFRNTKGIFEFARCFVPEDNNVQEIDTNSLSVGDKPEILIGLSEQEQLDVMLKIIRDNPNNNIGILVHWRKEIKKIREFLEKNSYSCADDAPEDLSFSYYYNGMDVNERAVVESKLKTPFILTIESCKGLEFDTVIMPFFEEADNGLTNYKPNNDNPDLDANGKPKTWTTPNHYYVASTRARSQLYVLFNTKPNILGFWNEEDTEDDELPF